MNNVTRDHVAELAVMYAAGLLPTSEAEKFEDLLNSGDSTAIVEFRRVSTPTPDPSPQGGGECCHVSIL